MVWAMDQVDQGKNNGFGGSSAMAGVTVSDSQQSDANQQTANQLASATCYTADCGQNCKPGTNQVAQVSIPIFPRSMVDLRCNSREVSCYYLVSFASSLKWCFYQNKCSLPK